MTAMRMHVFDRFGWLLLFSSCLTPYGQVHEELLLGVRNTSPIFLSVRNLGNHHFENLFNPLKPFV